MSPTEGVRRAPKQSPPPFPPRAVLFDFDGTLADTENHHVAAWQRTFALMGWAIEDSVCAKAMEQDDRAFLSDIFNRKKVLGGDVEGWVGRKQELTVRLLRDTPRLYPGVRELIERLMHIPLAVVTTTWRENVVAVLSSAGLVDAFRLIVAKEDVKAPKPDPEPYRLAVETLGIMPSDAVAFEDSPTGLASARAAGVHTVAVGHRRPHGDWIERSPFLPDLRDTEKAIDALRLA